MFAPSFCEFGGNMKLSEMNMREMATALCALAAPMSNIAKDEALCEKIQGMSGMMMDAQKPMIRKAGELLTVVPEILGKHYEDTIRIAAALTGKTPMETEEANAMEMISQIIESVDDRLLGFFKLSAATEQTEEA